MVGSYSATSNASSDVISSEEFPNHFWLVLFVDFFSTYHLQIEWKGLPCLVSDCAFGDRQQRETQPLEWWSKPTATDNPKYMHWHSKYSMVTAWLINSVDPFVGKTFIFCWHVAMTTEAVQKTCSDLDKSFTIVWIKHLDMEYATSDCEITTFYNDMTAVWQESDIFEDKQLENSNDSARYKKKYWGKEFVFLGGLNKEFDEVWGCILGKKPMPMIR